MLNDLIMISNYQIQGIIKQTSQYYEPKEKIEANVQLIKEKHGKTE